MCTSWRGTLMSEGVSQGKGCLELKIFVRYEGLKATQYFAKFSPESNVVLREDLLALKLPHPKRTNVTFISYGYVECVWPMVPKNGLLHKQIIAKTSPRSPDEKKEFRTLLKELSISTIVAKEIYPHDAKGWKNSKRSNDFTSQGAEEAGSSSSVPRSGNDYRVSYLHDAKGPRGMEEGSSSLARSGNQYPVDGGKGRKNLKRTNPFSSEGSPPRSWDDHSESRIRLRLPSTRKPHDSPAPKIAEAEAFLEDMVDSFRPRKILKMEPMDVPLPPHPPLDPLTRGRTIPNTPFQTNLETFIKNIQFEKSLKLKLPSSGSPSSHLSSTSKTTNPPESASSSSSLVNRKPSTGTRSHVNHASSPKPTITLASKSTNPPTSVPSSSSLIGQNPLQPKVKLPNIPSSQTKLNVPLPPKPLPPLTMLTRPGSASDPIQAMLRELQPLISPQSLPERKLPADADTKAMSMRMNPDQALQNSLDTNKSSDIPVVQRSTGERQITAGSLRYAATTSELKERNSAFIPSHPKTGLADAALEERLKKLEQELAAERRLRLEAEAIVEDIRRECKAPFVVPGLLDAFIKLSRLTTQATLSNGTVAKKNGS